MKNTPQIVKQIQNTQLKEIDYSYQNSISYSQITTYYQCPYKWYLTYVEQKGQHDHSIHSTFGTAMHEAIQKYIQVMYDESKTKAQSLDIVEIFKEYLKNTYQENYKDNKKQHFSDPSEISEFFEDGKEILEYFNKKVNKYFSKRGWHLVGIELPIRMVINPKYPNIIYRGFIDLVMYHEPTDTFKLYDIKTSTYSWGDKKKKDEHKQFQLILYKHLFSQLYGIDPKKIQIEFFVLKRKLYENCDFPQSRIQTINPPSGKVKNNKALTMVNNFIESCFDKDGKFKKREYIKDLDGCKWCPYSDDPQLCDKSNSKISIL